MTAKNWRSNDIWKKVADDSLGIKIFIKITLFHTIPEISSLYTDFKMRRKGRQFLEIIARRL